MPKVKKPRKSQIRDPTSVQVESMICDAGCECGNPGTDTGKRHRGWNWTDFKLHPIEEYKKLFDDEDLKYIVIGDEVTKSGKRHYQCYLQLHQARNFWPILFNRFPGISHIKETMKGEWNASKYCRKEGKYVEYGDPPAQGQRLDLDGFSKSIENGFTDKEIQSQHPIEFIKYFRSIEAVRNAVFQPCLNKRVLIIWGPKGTGKTTLARRICTPRGKIKFDRSFLMNYTRQKQVFLDEFNPIYMDIEVFNDLTHEFESIQPVKGGTVEFGPELLVIVSNWEPNFWYQNHPKFETAHRRVTSAIQWNVTHVLTNDEITAFTNKNNLILHY
ncbi:rep protein [Circoviridae sp.]|nr:rep protein [Circoviridae sp.]